MRYFDDGGVLWDVNPTSGSIVPSTFSVVSYYSEVGCAGSRYLIVGLFPHSAPRLPFVDQHGTGFRVFEDNASLQTVTACSMRFGENACSDFSQCGPQEGVPEGQTRIVDAPTLPGSPPYHPAL